MGGPGGPLAGTRVLDLVDGTGAYGTRLLAQLGADVIRVEPPSGSRHRSRALLWEADDRVPGAAPPAPASLYFLHYNAGKRAVTLDVHHPAGRALLARLLGRAEIAIDNGDLQALGFDLDALSRRNPPLVVISVTPFGLDGERAGWAGSDLISQAMSGMLGLYGYRDERPARWGPEQSSQLSGLAAALGALIALWGARRTGAGEHIDLAVERVCALVTFQMQNASLYHQFGFTRGRSPRGPGLPANLYLASDGYVAFNAWRDPEETIAVLAGLGRAGELPELRRTLPHAEFLADPRTQAAIVDFVASYTRAELTEIAQSRGMLALPVHDAGDLVADPFLRERGLFVEVEHPGIERTLLDIGAPIRFARTPCVAGRRPPLLGEHNAEIYAELGIDARSLARLAREGAV
ncbi:MAG: CoA transferase [Deltaproteobacteria bacterium]|nr:CoA transferase [Deltaproteobacteria bacterium]